MPPILVKRFLSMLLGIAALISGNIALLAADATAQSTVDRAIQAAGGRFGGVKGPMLWMDRGIYHANGSNQPFVTQYATRWPNWFRQEVEDVFTLTVSHGDAWFYADDQTQILNGDLRTAARHRAQLTWLTRLFPLKEPVYELSTIDVGESESPPVVGVRAKHESGGSFDLYFDAESYLLVRIETILTPLWQGRKPVSVVAHFSAHRSVGGTLVPAKMKLFQDGKLYAEMETAATKTGATLDPNFFATPSRD